MSTKQVREISWGGSRTIEYLVIRDDICAFKSVTEIGGKFSHGGEGIARLQTIKSVKDDEAISTYQVKVGPAKYLSNIHVKLCFNQIKEVFRQNSYGRPEYYAGQERFMIAEPYTFLTASPDLADTVDLYLPNNSDGYLYNLEGKTKYPRGMVFNYIDGQMHNGHYNLKAALEILKKRTDILWEDDHAKPAEPEIHPIPYYNADREKDMGLNFVWIPSDEDWVKVLPYYDVMRFEFYEKICELVFGFKRQEKKKKARDYDEDSEY
jgi:hypothetical protein